MQNEAQRQQALEQLAEAGANPIVMTGFAFGDSLTAVAAEYPNTKFAIIDMVVDAPNVKSVVFTEDQGSYLAGVMAGMASKTGTVGFVGGMDIPLIRRFRVRLCARRDGGQSQGQGHPEHDRHRSVGLEQPGERCRNRQIPAIARR